MSVSIGGIDLFSQGLNNEYRIIVLEKIIDTLLKETSITQEEIDSIKKKALSDLQTKYPKAGITEVRKK